jgi:hypothetical protein
MCRRTAVAGIGDFDGNGMSDTLWRDTSGDAAIWFINGTQVSTSVPTNWTVAGTGDFSGDHMSDLLWRDTSGDNAVWLMNGGQILSSLGLGQGDWQVAVTGDYNGDHTTDVLWYTPTFGLSPCGS